MYILILIWIWYVAKIHIIIWIYFKTSFSPLYMWSLNKGMKVILQLHAFSSVSFPGVPEKLKVNKAIGCCPLKDFYRNDSSDWTHCQRYLWIMLCFVGCLSQLSPLLSRVVSFGLVNLLRSWIEINRVFSQERAELLILASVVMLVFQHAECYYFLYQMWSLPWSKQWQRVSI